MEDNFSNYFSETGKVAREYVETRLDLIKLRQRESCRKR